MSLTSEKYGVITEMIRNRENRAKDKRYVKKGKKN
jgi:hypothetical protein